MADEDKKNNDAKPSEEEAAFDSAAAVDAIVEGTRNRADEIEEALEGALDPVVLSQDPNDDAKEITKEIEIETEIEIRRILRILTKSQVMQ